MAKGRRYAKSAYRMTSRRKTALRKAQLASAKKRKRRNAAIAVGVLAGVGAVSVYGGYKHGDKISNIASDLKRRTPTLSKVRKSQRKAASTVSPEATHKVNVETGVTGGMTSTAGPSTRNTTPPKPPGKITDADRAHAQREREKLDEYNRKHQSLVFGEGPASRKDADGNGKDRSEFGIPGAVKAGRKLSGKKISSLVDERESAKAALGVDGLDLEGRQEAVDQFVADGTARGKYQGELTDSYDSWKKRSPKQRKRIKARKARRRAAARQAREDVQLSAFEQFLKDYEP